MNRMIRWGTLGLVFSTAAAARDTEWPESVREAVTRVCGFCHFPDFFDLDTGELIEDKFLAKSELILDRLERPVGTPGRMPPKRSPIHLTEEERQSLLDFVKAQPIPVPAPTPDPIQP